MSFNFLNLHAKDGEPLGEDAEVMSVAEYYTDAYIILREYLDEISSVECAPEIIHEYTAKAKNKLMQLIDFSR